MEKIYIVQRNGIHEYDTDSLYRALQYIGSSIKGRLFACMTVTVKELIDAGFSIRIC